MGGFDVAQKIMSVMPLYGPQVLALAGLGCALGLPLPMPMLVLLSGMLAQRGELNPVWSIAGCLAGSLAGESVYFAAGRYGSAWIQKRSSLWVAGAWQRAQERFAAQAALTIYLTRFLLTPLALPVNLIAGARRYPFWRFMLAAVAGDFMWVAGYGLAGYLGGSNWQDLGATVASYGAVAGAAIAGYVALRYLWHNRMRFRRVRRLWMQTRATVQLS